MKNFQNYFRKYLESGKQFRKKLENFFINQDIEIKVSKILLKLKNFKSEYILNHKVPKLESCVISCFEGSCSDIKEGLVFSTS